MNRQTAILAVLIIALALYAWHGLISGRRLPKHRVAHMHIRLRLRLRPGPGHASLIHLWRRWGRYASWRESKRTRPFLPPWQRIRHPQEHSAYLGRAHMRHTVRVTVQEHGAVIGPPRSNKSGLLSRLIMDWPGPVVSTSSKADIYGLTKAIRETKGPVWIFNPQLVGNLQGNVFWDPVEGCVDEATAIRRGHAFANAASTRGAEGEEFWRREAGTGLTGLLSAAALARQNLRKVSRWIGTSAETPEAVTILNTAHREDQAAKVAELNGAAERTAQTIRTVMSSAIGFMHDPILAASTCPAPGQGFDIDAFILSRGTLFMIARSDEQDSVLAPLFAALATEIQHRATQIAATMPGGRLDPPMLMALDEVTQICPVPLPSWLADSGGQGITIWTAFHGFAQLRDRWRDAGAQIVLDTSNCKIIMPGVADVGTLEQFSKLTGHAAYIEHGQDNHSRHEVMSPDMLRSLPHGWALVLRGAHRPVIVKVALGWKHREARRLNKLARRLASAPAIETIPFAQTVIVPFTIPDAQPQAVNRHSHNGRADGGNILHWGDEA